MEISLSLPLWPRQRLALLSRANDQLFGGASEGGKSYFGRVVTSLAGLQCEGLQMTLIRKKVDDILSNHLEGDRGYRRMLYPLTNAGVVDITEKRIRFPRDNVLNFKHCQDERQFDSAQGNENQLLFVDEAPQIKERLIRAFRGWVRMTPEHRMRQPKFWQGKLPWALFTGNPIGESVGYFRREYVKVEGCAPFDIRDLGGFRRQYVPSRVEDNPAVDQEAHSARLSEMGDEQLALALDTGDWDALVGDFIRQWDDERHRVPDFTPPTHWLKFRSFDWGGDEPFAVYWWCVSDGEDFIDFEHGQRRWFPRGALIAYREWYGCNPDKPAKGIDMQNELIAKAIVARTHETTNGITVTDNLPFQTRGGEIMADVFARNGCPLTQGNTDRVTGWKQLKDLLSGRDQWPLLYFTRSCKYAADYIPALPRHPSKKEDAAEDGEATHCCDAIRLACMTRPRIKDAPKKPLPHNPEAPKMSATPRAILKQLQRQRRREGRR